MDNSRYLMTLIIIINLAINVTHGQDRDSLRSEVFVLSACDPNSFSLFKKITGNKDRLDPVKRFEVFSNRSNSFQITGINPLRYKYYINNEAITQFIEPSTITLNINNFLNGDVFNGAPEIRIPEIFRTDSISTKVKVKVQDFKRQDKEIADSLLLIQSKISDIWNKISSVPFNKTIPLYSDTTAWKSYRLEEQNYYRKQEADFFKDGTHKSLFSKSKNLQFKRDRLFSDYQMFISQLSINDSEFALLKQYRTLSFSGDKDLDLVRSIQKQFSIDYEEHTKKFKKIEKLITQLQNTKKQKYIYDPMVSYDSLRKRDNAEYNLELRLKDSLENLLAIYNFILAPTAVVANYASSATLNSTQEGPLTSYYIKQQIVDKRFQLYEEFVLNVIAKIGVLVQNQFREYSSQNNTLENLNCIDTTTLSTIKSKRNDLSNTFKFIQQTSAELQILVSYLDINTELYQSIAKKINNNYLFLLSYLKNLDYLTKENSNQYTLPTHNNLRNIDLIRYTIKREDKITKNSQTYNYDFWLKGGLKVDFSVALIGSSLTDNTYNKILLNARNSTDSASVMNSVDSIRITRQDDGRADFAFGGMVNITPRNGGRWLNIGGSIGVAYSTNQKLQILASAAMHFGKTERIVAHVGLAFGRVKYLDISASDFKFYGNEGGFYKAINRDNLKDIKEKDRIYILSSTDVKYTSYVIPTFEKFTIRPFIGISYNLSKKNALQAVSGTGLSTYNTNLNGSAEK